MSRALLCVIVSVAVLAASGGQARAGEEKGIFGIGLIVGEPSGVSAKYYLSNDTALQAGLGAGLIDVGFHVHTDFVWHPVILDSQETFVLPLYVGPGLRFLVEDSGRGDAAVYHAGVRAVGGVVFDFRTIPIDVFVEVAPIFEYNFSDNDADAGFGVAVNAAAGVRYFF